MKLYALLAGIAVLAVSVVACGCALVPQEPVELVIGQGDEGTLKASVLAEGKLVRQWQVSPPAVLLTAHGTSVKIAGASDDGTLFVAWRQILRRGTLAVSPGSRAAVGKTIIHNALPARDHGGEVSAVLTLVPSASLLPRGTGRGIVSGTYGEVGWRSEVRWLDVPAGTCWAFGDLPLSAGRGWPDPGVRRILDSLVIQGIDPDGTMRIEVAGAQVELRLGLSWTGFLVRDRQGRLACSTDPGDGLVARVDISVGGGRP